MPAGACVRDAVRCRCAQSVLRARWRAFRPTVSPASSGNTAVHAWGVWCHQGGTPACPVCLGRLWHPAKPVLWLEPRRQSIIPRPPCCTEPFAVQSGPAWSPGMSAFAQGSFAAMPCCFCLRPSTMHDPFGGVVGCSSPAGVSQGLWLFFR